MSTIGSDAAEASQGVSEAHLSADAVLERMKEVAKLKSDSELANWLHISRSAISKWRKRNAVPYAEAVMLALLNHSSLDYILTGRNPDSEPQRQQLDRAIIRAALLNLYAMQTFEPRGADEPLDQIQLMAQGIALQYERGEAMMRKLAEVDGLSLEDARKAAITGMELMSSAGDAFGKRFAPKKGPQ
jgi:DNA-binding transcriptional regulator YiaG